ncbi:DNA-3-methyladenine glycosylase family protein [Psychrobacillus antarcticus]|uniref:DNA-3-methyladenine glycosylase family protein n=1 Tax=Psychrobacillus antarcticus TaxID=2879115 RepID=UPI002407E513|nr:DNA-3-methyladenine glycosylase [Psychrobacillus antarcticus]
MQWSNHGSFIEIYPPKEFNFDECLVFLGRSQEEVLHQIRDGLLYKLINVNVELILCRIGFVQHVIHVDFPIRPLSMTSDEEIVAYIWEWFDLDQDLSIFYEVAKQDKILQQIHKRYYGLRMMCIPDLFEALTWAIMGQQINLTFAYKLKQRFVEHFGECLTFEGNTFWLYPTYERIATLGVEDLITLQFTVRKAEYVIGVAEAMRNGELTKEMLLQEPTYLQAQKSLLGIRGVGPWTADYVLMKCLHYPDAFLITDVGLHNALKAQLGLERKPTIEEIKEMATNWEGWQAYATFYLWRSLYE